MNIYPVDDDKGQEVKNMIPKDICANMNNQETFALI